MFAPHHKVCFIKLDLTNFCDAFLHIRTPEFHLAFQHQFAINLSVKQATPNLLQKLLQRPVLQFAFLWLTDQQASIREIGKCRQAKFIGMSQMPHIHSRHDLAFRMWNRSRKLGKAKLFANHPPNHTAFHKVSRCICPRQRSSELFNSGNSIDP